MMDVDRVFIDTNVITAATIDVAPLHQQALNKLDQLWQLGTDLYISQQVIREYMVNATRPQTYSPALPMNRVLQQVQQLQRSFYVLSEEPEILNRLLLLAGEVSMGGKHIHDASIVATMLVNDIDELLTNNVKDFERFQSYIHVMPLVETV